MGSKQLATSEHEEQYAEKRRDQFLIAMYGEVWNNINRHLTVMWESVAILAGAFAIFALVEKHTLPPDLASSLVILLSAWLIGHTYDANTWFNRNLAIVTNIERQFLRPEDSRQIHFYFTKHRDPANMLDHLLLQRNLGFGIALLVLGEHLFTRVTPGIGASWATFEPERTLPYVVALASGLWIRKFRARRVERQREFLRESPGQEPNQPAAVDDPGAK